MTPTAERTKNGKIVWRVKYLVARRRVRLTFRTRDEARRWIEDHGDIATTEGQIFWMAWRAITSKERHELMDSIVLMRAHRVTHPKSNIVEAVKAHIARENAIRSSISMQEAVDRYLASKLNNKRKGSVSAGWYRVLEPCLQRVARELESKTLVEFSTDEVEEYLDDQDWSPRTFNNYHAYISGLYKWAIENKVATENPVAKIEKFSKKMLSKEVIVPAVPVVCQILKASKKPQFRNLRAAIDCGFGLAMRSSEISGMDWCNVGDKVIHIPAGIAKNGVARNIQRTPLLDGVFRSLLSQRPKSKTGPLVPAGWRRDLTKLFESVGLGKPRNIMRKSGGSYYYHATGSEPMTQELMGHTEDSNIFSASYKALNYGDPTKKTPIGTADGKAYYRLWK